MPLNWGQVTQAVTTKKVDLFCIGVWPEAARRKNMLLSDPVGYNTIYVYVRNNDERLDLIKVPEELNDPKFKGAAVEGEGVAAMIIKYFPKATKAFSSPLTSTAELILHVATGKADFIALDESEMNAYLAHNPNKIRKVSEEPFVMKQLQIPLASNEHHLLNTINGLIRDYSNDGTLAKLIKKHDIEGIMLPKYETIAP